MENENVLSLSLQDYIDKITELKSKLDDLSKTSQEYKNVVNQLKTVNDSLNGSFQTFVDNGSNVSSSIGELINGITNLKEQFGSLDFNSDSLSGFVQNIDSIKSNLENLNISSDIVSEFDSLKSSLESISETDIKINIDTDSISSFKADLESAVASVSQLQTDIRVEVNKGDIEGFLSLIQDIQKEINTLQNNLSNLRVNIDAGELQNVEAQIDNLSDKTVNLSLVSNVQDVIQNVNEELDSITDKTVNIDVNANINDDSLNKFKDELDSISEVNIDVQTNINEESLDSVKQNLDSITDKTVSIIFTDEDLLRIKEDVQELTERLNDISENQIEINADNESLENTKQSIIELKERISELQAELDKTDTHTQEYQNLSGQINKLQGELRNLIGSGVDPTVDSIANLVSSIQDMKSELQNLEIGSDKFVELSEKIKESQERLAELKNQMGDNAESVQSLSSAMVSALSNMGLSIGGLEKSFNAATAASNGFKVALDMIKAHPIIAVLTILLGLLYKLKSATEENEEASKSWRVAMAAFQPILDAVNTAIGWLVEGMGKVAEWLGEQIPSVIRFIGKYWNFLISGIGNVVEAFLWLPIVVGKVFDAVANTFKDGISWIVGAVADLLDIVGLGDSLHEVERDIDNFKFNVGGSLESFSNNTKKWFDNAANAVTNYADKWAATTDTHIKKAKEMNKVDEEIRQQQVRNAESELKVAKLRKAAAEEGDPKKRLAIMKEINAEILRNGKEQVELAKKQYELAAWYAEQAPNSKADNDRLARLKANVLQTEAAYTNSLVRISKQERELQEALQRQAEAKTAKEKKEAAKQVKIAEDTLKAKLKAAQEYVSNYNTLISNIQTETESKVSQVRSNKELVESMGLLTPEKAREYQNEMYNIQKAGLDRILEETEKALDSEEITEEQRLQLQVKYSSLIIQSYTEENNNKKALNKITLDEINKDTQDKLKELENTYKSSNALNGYIDQLKDMEPKLQEQVLNSLSLSDENKTLIYDSFDSLTADIKENILDAMQVDSEAKNRILEGISITDEDKQLVISNLQNLSKDVQTEVLNMLNIDPSQKEQIILGLSVSDEEKEQILESLRSYNEDKISLDLDLEDAEHEHQMRMLDIQFERLQTLKEQFGEDSEYFKNAQAQYNADYEAEEERHSNAMITLYNKTAEEAKKSVNTQIKFTQQLMKSTGSLMGSIADIMEENIKQKVENGEISEEEAQKEFERVKQIQIAETVVNTIAGAAGGLLQAIKTYPAPYGPILGGITAAAALTAGYAQVQQIKNQKFGSAGSGSAGSSAGSSIQTVDFQSVQVNPLLDEQRDLQSMRTLSETQETQEPKEQRVVILQSDLEESSKQVSIREQSSTF